MPPKTPGIPPSKDTTTSIDPNAIPRPWKDDDEVANGGGGFVWGKTPQTVRPSGIAMPKTPAMPGRMPPKTPGIPPPKGKDSILEESRPVALQPPKTPAMPGNNAMGRAPPKTPGMPPPKGNDSILEASSQCLQPPKTPAMPGNDVMGRAPPKTQECLLQKAMIVYWKGLGQLH